MRLPCLRHARWLPMLAAGLLAAGSAMADLANPVTVNLIAPGGVTDGPTFYDSTPINAVQTVDYTTPITATSFVDGATVAELLLAGEQLFLVGNSIRFTAMAYGIAYNEATNSINMVTGYLNSGASRARYVFSGLSVPGMRITGATVNSFDGFVDTPVPPGTFNGLDLSEEPDLLSWEDTDGDGNVDSFSFYLDNQMVFAPRADSGGYADIRIDLTTVPVPEPATWGLTLAGLALVAARAAQRRRQANSAAGAPSTRQAPRA